MHICSLKRHKESMHEELQYICDECAYTATRYGHLNTQRESKHQGARYPHD